MVKSKKGHNLVNILRNSLKSQSSHLNIDPKPYAKYKNLSSSGSQVIVLTKFLWPSRKRGITLSYKGRPKKIRARLFFVLMLYIKFQVPSSVGSLVSHPTKGVTDNRTDRRTDEQTDGPKSICSLNFFEVGGHKNDKIGKNRCLVFFELFDRVLQCDASVVTVSRARVYRPHTS